LASGTTEIVSHVVCVCMTESQGSVVGTSVVGTSVVGTSAAYLWISNFGLESG